MSRRTAAAPVLLALALAACGPAGESVPDPSASATSTAGSSTTPSATPTAGGASANGFLTVLVHRDTASEVRGIDLLSGTQEWVFTAPRGAVDLSWSPDGERLAVVVLDASGNFYASLQLLTADGEAAETIDDIFSAAWSPDSTMLALQTTDGLYLYDLEDGQERRVGPHWWLSVQDWSPDGESILVTSDESDPATPRIGEPMDRLYRLSLSDDSQVALTELGYHYDACWSPDGRRVAFMRGDGVSFHTDGFILDLVDGQLTHLGKVGWARCPWSPDGQRLVVDTGDAAFIITPEGEPLVTVATGSPGELIETIGWSSDGGWVLLTRGSGSGIGASTVEAVTADGSERILLGDGDLAEWRP